MAEDEEGTPFYGYQNDNGETVCLIHKVGTRPDPFVSGMRRIIKDGNIGFINPKGVIVIPPTYQLATLFTKKICAVNIGATPVENSATDQYSIGEKAGGKWGVINKKGETIVPFSFDRRWNEKTGRYEYFKGTEVFYITRKGKIEFVKIASHKTEKRLEP